ncbi:MAG TPA: hypothetical protein VMM60_12525, partial [Ilumatobacter sp.]|nr:hypothetical protein [Ilumatobacter sp.]
GFGLASATVSTGEQPVYIAIDPCRLTDTRPEFLVGPRATPYGPAETVTWVGTGLQGNCNVPAGVSALVMNVTAIDATLPTYLQFAPGNTVTPGGASSLNPVPGEPPTPNAVTIPIDDEGEFSIYNLQGTVDVIIDVVGYYDDHEHTGADIEDLSLEGVDIMNSTISSAKLSNEPGISFTTDGGTRDVTTAEDVFSTVRIRPPSNGLVKVHATVDWGGDAVGTTSQLRCSISEGSTHTAPVFRDAATISGGLAHTFALEAVFPVDAYTGLFISGDPFNLVCNMSSNEGSVYRTQMSATFYPTSYAPGNLLLEPIFPIGLDEPAAGDEV